MISFFSNRPTLRPLIVTGAFLLLPSLLSAHPGHDGTTGFAYGFLHPFSGIDHLCAMIAVGLLATRYQERVRWTIPITFVVMMAIGGLLAATGVTVSFVEEGIIASLLILGALIAAAVRLPSAVALPLIGLFALVHGHAHGTEMSEGMSGLMYGSGFLLSTFALHLGGILLVLTLRRFEKETLVRYAGFGIAAIGIATWMVR